MDKICGIDEAGRGPLAGPLVVAGVVLKENIIGLNDSKVLSKKTREKLFEQITNKSRYHIVFSDSKKIDKYGLSYCVKNSIVEIMNNLQNYTKSFLIDGNTNFGINNLQKEIKADAKYPFVSAASILAKVSRDRYMEKIANLYKEYNFEKNKGYGTKQHIDAIKLYGRSDIHRKSFKLKQLNEI